LKKIFCTQCSFVFFFNCTFVHQELQPDSGLSLNYRTIYHWSYLQSDHVLGVHVVSLTYIYMCVCVCSTRVGVIFYDMFYAHGPKTCALCMFDLYLFTFFGYKYFFPFSVKKCLSILHVFFLGIYGCLV